MTLHHPKIVEDLIAIPKVISFFFPVSRSFFFFLYCTQGTLTSGVYFGFPKIGWVTGVSRRKICAKGC